MLLGEKELFYRLSTLGDLSPGPSVPSGGWEAAARFALRLESPLVFFSNLKKLGAERFLEPDTLQKLKADASSAVWNGLRRMSFFHEVATLLNGERIRFVPLKGISLLTDTYPAEALRWVNDLDLLISPADEERCLRSLEAQGYTIDRPLYGGVSVNQGQEFVAIKDGVEVDVHTRFFPWYEERHVYGIDSGDFFREAAPKRWQGADVAYLRKEDEFYYLVLCAFREGYRLFRYYQDADSVVRVHGAHWDWKRIERHLDLSPVRRGLRHVIEFMADKLKTPIPLAGSQKNSLRGAGRDGLVEKQILRAPMTIGQRRRFCFLHAGTARHRLSLAWLYIKWQVFKISSRIRKFRPRSRAACP